MKLLITDEAGHSVRVTDEEALDAARDFAEWRLEEEDQLEAPIEPQGQLVALDTWVPWRAQLALACAESCGAVVYVDDSADPDGDGVVLELVGVAEDAQATRRIYRRLERVVMRAIKRACAGRSVEWIARWAAEHVDRLREDIDIEADAALARAYRQKVGGGVSVVWEEEDEPEDRAALARTWLADELGIDEIAVVPEPAHPGVVDMAAFAARQSSS